MCGFAGIFSSAGVREEQLVRDVERMIDPIAHRGPDDSGVFTDPSAGVALGFRRLAIIDLSALGHQPMRSGSGRFTLVFNGEVFNHNELRADLLRDGFTFRGHSDTEVILASFERWGVQAAVKRFVGMFAIAAWDRERRELSLIRDRLGIKPLFVYRAPSGVVTFGSELKALAAGPVFDNTLNRDALQDFLRYLYVPGPQSIYQHITKLPPGHVLTIADPRAPLPASVAYWSVEEVARRGLADQLTGSDEEVVDQFDALLSDAVKMRMEADVPLGALLSGGIDSSVVVALLQQHAARPVKTFSVAFDAEEHNEAHHAAAIAKHLGTDHTEYLLTGKEALDVVPKLPDIFDEPHGDTSQIPAYLICGVARREVTVALTGDGGDEVYGGYNRYTYGERMLQKMMRVPRPARRAVAAGIGTLSPAGWDRAHRFVRPMLPSSLKQRLPGDKVHKIGRIMGADSLPGMYRSLVSVWQDAEGLVVNGRRHRDRMEEVLSAREPRQLLDRMMLADQLTYLTEDQLAKVDRVSMANSLEVRVPLLDHRLVEFSWRAPSRFKIRDGKGKWLLRQVLYRRVPRELIERPKMGLSVPLGQWLRGPLRGWAEELLSADRLTRDGILHSAPIRAAWDQLQAGRDETALGLWAVLMFQGWKARWLGA
ncbi:MAG TPA: asparagine synthase (glutamine-hydrolyzing) [Gemmatimonadaceae bacterium]|nr:asparagine synthase (glutamine-hydrolyzing) [Gemmatimonadaceae bacterium]